ncbi:MAG: hypothetical protein KGM99_12270 [Burkholderiales bacterium]|nr:hypothetical protein [Burkholderiales bacterium]
MSGDFLMQIIAAVFTAGSIYTAIRGDIKNIHEKLTDHKEKFEKLEKEDDVLHNRINDIIKGK